MIHIVTSLDQRGTPQIEYQDLALIRACREPNLDREMKDFANLATFSTSRSSGYLLILQVLENFLLRKFTNVTLAATGQLPVSKVHLWIDHFDCP